ncbi:mutase-like protein [Seminavis robusta]|uniref:Mutase-like protein n=1 Tax=Seminavis robusta TaxID=568900 RepID=A0A9N8F3T1_9STRA|nr:mutase-like protein [Seminavis robusta]|eukprot:Sro3235_g345740.1 mutase-like protein (618) ;mRNA; f:2667-4986
METIVVDGVNRMGNAMVEWFDNQTRGSSLGFGTSRPSASLVDIRDPFGLGSTNSLRGSDFEPIGWDTSSTQSLSRLDSESILSGFGSELDDSTRERPHGEVTGNPPPPDCVVIRANRDKAPPTPPVSTRKGASSARRSASTGSEKAHQSIHDTKGEVTGTVGDSGTEKVYVSYNKAEGPGRRTAQTEEGSPKGGGWRDNSKERTWVADDDSPADDNGVDPLSILSKGGSLGSGGDNDEPTWAASGESPASNGGDRLSIRSKGRASFRKKWMRTIAEDNNRGDCLHQQSNPSDSSSIRDFQCPLPHQRPKTNYTALHWLLKFRSKKNRFVISGADGISALLTKRYHALILDEDAVTNIHASMLSRTRVLLNPVNRVNRIICVRHGESLGNVDDKTYGRIADWKIPLSDLGREEARDAGRRLAKLLGPDQRFVVYHSPYKRATETCYEMLKALPADAVIGSIREEPRIVEQQFGNFQNYEEIQNFRDERVKFGRFFYRFPSGEAGMDVYSRVTSFISTINRDASLLRQEGYDMDKVNVLIVTHGLTLRLFLMRWFQISVEEFEDMYNPDNGFMAVMERKESECGRKQFYELTEESAQHLRIKTRVTSWAAPLEERHKGR